MKIIVLGKKYPELKENYPKDVLKYFVSLHRTISLNIRGSMATMGHSQTNLLTKTEFDAKICP